MIATSDKKLINRKVLEQNLKRFFYLPLIAIPINIGHIFLFYFSMPEPDTIEFTWRWGIIFTHTLLIILSLFIGLLAYVRRKHHRPSDSVTFWLINILILLVVFVGVAITIIDQLVTPAITPFLVICTVVAVVFLIRPINALIMYLSSYGLFFYMLPFTQSNPEILLSNRVNGLSFIGIGFLISIILWRNNWSGFQQKIVIDEQNQELESNNIELKDQASRLLELNATKDKFFSIIAHDLKSPFNSILGFSELLVEKIQNKDYTGTEKYAGTIYNSSQKAMELIVSLMQWSSAQSGRMDFNPDRIEFVSLIDEAVELSKDAAQHKLISITTKHPEAILIMADKDMMSAVLRNLISNAIKFTNDKGLIEIKASIENRALIVSLKDNGVGISVGHLQHLFRLDQSVSTLGTHHEKGTGLGLLLCKEFIEKHGGKIWVESERGKGSIFHFSIPTLD